MTKVNLVIVYKKVKQRIRNASGLQKELAILATAAAKEITINPTLKAVKTFRKLEDDWRQNANRNSKSLANEFEAAIQSKNFMSESVYNSSQTGYLPEKGFLYCFASNEYPGIVKIGSTTYEINNRLLTYKSRHNFDHLEIVFYIETSDPATKEEQIHSLLSSSRIYPETIPNSSEWFKISQKKAVKLIKEFA
jgi:hypothetical protein